MRRASPRWPARHLPIRGIVQQVIATNPVAPVLRQLVAQMGLHLSLKQGDGGHLLIGGGWPGALGADGATRLKRRSIQGNLWTAAQVMPALAGLEVIRAWTGLAVYLDRGPMIGAGPVRPVPRGDLERLHAGPDRGAADRRCHARAR